MLRVYEPWLGEEEVQAVVDCLRRGAISGNLQGDYLAQFEAEVARSCGVRYGVATTSGTTALALAVAVAGLGPGDEALVPALTNIATAFAVCYVGARPVFVDVEPDTWNLDPEDTARKLTPRTRAILPVHLYGHPVEMGPILEMARDRHLWVIEDAAEAHGALYRGRPVGGLGQMGCLSFFANKVITTGEGGMVVTDDPDLAERARFLKNLGYAPGHKFLHTDLAYNFRMTNLQAGIGLAQMRRFEEVLRRKRWVAEQYTRRLRGVQGLRLPVERPHARNIYWMYGVVLEEGMPDRDTVCRRMAEMGVETRPFFHPLHLQPVFRKLGIVDGTERLPVAEFVGARGFYLPSSPLLTEDQIDEVCEKLLIALRTG